MVVALVVVVVVVVVVGTGCCEWDCLATSLETLKFIGKRGPSSQCSGDLLFCSSCSSLLFRSPLFLWDESQTVNWVRWSSSSSSRCMVVRMRGGVVSVVVVVVMRKLDGLASTKRPCWNSERVGGMETGQTCIDPRETGLTACVDDHVDPVSPRELWAHRRPSQPSQPIPGQLNLIHNNLHLLLATLNHVSVSISVSTRACHFSGRAKAGFDSPTESFICHLFFFIFDPVPNSTFNLYLISTQFRVRLKSSVLTHTNSFPNMWIIQGTCNPLLGTDEVMTARRRLHTHLSLSTGNIIQSRILMFPFPGLTRVTWRHFLTNTLLSHWSRSHSESDCYKKFSIATCLEYAISHSVINHW